MYAVHFYAATHKDDLRNKVKTALDNGLPVFVSEFSLCDASGNGGIDYDSSDEWFKMCIRDRYKAVMKPKEGTILTVAKGVASKARECADADMSLAQFCDCLLYTSKNGQRLS